MLASGVTQKKWGAQRLDQGLTCAAWKITMDLYAWSIFSEVYPTPPSLVVSIPLTKPVSVPGADCGRVTMVTS